jgi:outer membrane biosynthesis protein TonB
MIGWAIAAMLAIAAASYWLGMASNPDAPVESDSGALRATVPLPPPVEPAAPDAKPEPIVAPPIPIIVERPVIKRIVVERVVTPTAEPPATVEETATPAAESETPAAAESNAVPEPPPPAKPVYTGPWPVRVVDGASGRLVRIGAFRTARQAKKGWWAIVRNNPAMKHLPALVVPVQSWRNGQVYYRLQMGTTSQAHSTVLCQRMRMIGQSCVVIDERRA